MNKFIIKPLDSILLNPRAVENELKKDILLYDGIGMLNHERLIEELYTWRQFPSFQHAFNEISFLIEQNKFVDLKSLFIEGDIDINDSDGELLTYINQLKENIEREQNEDKRKELYWQLEHLNTRFWSAVANASNESIYAIPSLNNLNSFTIPNTTTEKAYQVIHKLIPLPSEITPWEKIFDFKNDEEACIQLYELRNWINNLPDDIKQNELSDKINYLHMKYLESLKRHKIESRLSTIKTVVKTIPTAFSEAIKLKFDKSIDAFFSVAEQQVNFQKYKQRKEFIGHELAYIVNVNNKFNKKKNKNYR